MYEILIFLVSTGIEPNLSQVTQKSHVFLVFPVCFVRQVVKKGPCKVRNETETKRNETKHIENETKQIETIRNRSKRNETNRNETKRNK